MRRMIFCLLLMMVAIVSGNPAVKQTRLKEPLLGKWDGVKHQINDDFSLFADIIVKTRHDGRNNDSELGDKPDGGRWDPNDVPYYIDPSLDVYSSVIEEAVKEFESATCLKFRELEIIDIDNWPVDHIVFNSSQHGCTSFIGRQGGRQPIGIEADTCAYKGVIMHEIFHALGFRHEHNRPDRDRAIRIAWDNVDPDMVSHLQKLNPDADAATYGEKYDYSSLLHGGNYLFAIDPSKMTLMARTDPSLVLGQRRYLSPTDIRRLNAHYSCLGTTTASTTTTESATTTAASVTSQKCNGLIPNYADPTDCTRFYVCSGTKATLMVCPSGLYYNPVNYVCDWPANVYCPLDGDSNSTADK